MDDDIHIAYKYTLKHHYIIAENVPDDVMAIMTSIEFFPLSVKIDGQEYFIYERPNRIIKNAIDFIYIMVLVYDNGIERIDLYETINTVCLSKEYRFSIFEKD